MIDETIDELTLFEKLEFGYIEHPKKVRCMNCGEMAELIDLENTEGLIVRVYQCDDCRFYTEWEILDGGEDGIDSSNIWLVDPDDDDRESRPARDFPYYWKPMDDGYSVPDWTGATK